MLAFMVVLGKQWLDKLPTAHMEICLSPGWETENLFRVALAIYLHKLVVNM